MTSTPSASTTRPRGFQFRIATLLSLMLWTALVAWGLASLTEFAYSVHFITMLVMMFTSVVATIYCRGRRRAFAVGFLVFSCGYWAAIRVVVKAMGSIYVLTPASGIVETLYGLVHGPLRSPQFPTFTHICNFALTMLLGFVGGVIATLLYTEPRQPAGSESSPRASP